MLKKLLFIFLFFECIQVAGHGLNLKFRHFTSKDGLVQNNVVSILQDSKGFMWFGTRDGLNRFDGYNFRLYEYHPDVPYSVNSNQVSSMCEDRQGFIWIRYLGGGLDRYNPETDRFENFNKISGSPVEIPASNVAAIAEDSEQNLWIGTYGGGLFRINKARNRMVRIMHNPEDSTSIAYNSIRTIIEDSRGDIWFGFWAKKGVDRYDPDTGVFEHYTNNTENLNSLVGNSIFKLFEDSGGNIWVATNGSGVSCYHPEENEFRNFIHDEDDENTLSSNFVRAIIEDDRGNIWFGTENGGISIYNPSKGAFTNLFQDDIDTKSLNNNSIYSLYKDSDGNIWVGTYTGGVNVYFKNYNTFEHFRKKNSDQSLSHNSVTSFNQDYPGNIWVGTDGGGVNVVDLEKRSYKAFRARRHDKATLGSDYVMGITRDSKLNMWVGTWGGGLNKYDFNKREFVRFTDIPSDETSINSNNVSMAYEDHAHNIWVGTFGGGLNLLDAETGTFTHFLNDRSNPQTISNNHIVNIIEGENHFLWIGTDGGGVNMLRHNGTFRQFLGVEGSGRGLRSGDILCSMKDHNGDLWFGTNKGLHKLNADNLHFYYHSLGDSISEVRVLGIEEDENENLWISSNDGLLVFNPETGFFRRYTPAHGLQDVEFNRGASFKDDQGFLYFGGINGFNRFHPDSVRVAVSPPPVEIVEFEVFNRSVKIGGKDSLLKKSITETDYIEIPWRYSLFSLEYVALNYNFSEEIEYAFMLEHFDKEWYYVGKNRKATYTNLDPGRYIFKIKCRTDGIWGREQRKLEIVILPPFWQTFWFRGLIVLGIILIFVVFFWYRTRRIKKLNSLVNRRTEEIWQQNKALENQKKQLTRINSMLIDRQEKIEVQAKELYYQRNELKQTNATKDKFLSIIAHDLRNPFNTIIGFSELLLVGFKSFRQEEVEQQLKQILNSAEQTYNLLEDLLLWANSQSGKMVAYPSEVDVKEVCLQIIAFLSDQGKRKNIDIQFFGDDGIIAKADRFMLKTIIRNLLSNAIKFTETGGFVKISVRKEAGSVVVSVADNGLGIGEEHLRKLWDITGQTSRRGTENEQGSGLGLLLCKEFVEKQGGNIFVESKLGEGSNVSFTIPPAN